MNDSEHELHADSNITQAIATIFIHEPSHFVQIGRDKRIKFFLTIVSVEHII